MRYLKLIDLPSTDLTKEEEDYLDSELRHDFWCKRNQGNYGRLIHISEAVEAFKENIYYMALEMATNGDDKLLKYIKDKNNLDFNEKKRRAKEVPITSLITTEIRQNKTICPFHEDNNASLHVYENTNSYYCYTCHVGGDTIDFIQRLNGCTFPEAVNYLS
jgi:hypothetical protein